MAKALAVVAGTGIAISVACLTLAAALAGNDFDNFRIRDLLFRSCGEGNLAGIRDNMREIAWESDDDEVTINVPATVTYSPGTGAMLIARGSPEVLSHLTVRGGRVEFDCRGLSVDSDLDLILPGLPLSDFTLNGSGRLILENINQPELDISIRGAGKVEARGTVENVELSIAGAGEARFGDLAVKTMEVSIAGAGDAEIAPEDEADISIAGAGEIRLLTEPRNIKTSIAGIGNIVHAQRAPGAPAR
jgi:hypothetical protein